MSDGGWIVPENLVEEIVEQARKPLPEFLRYLRGGADPAPLTRRQRIAVRLRVARFRASLWLHDRMFGKHGDDDW